MSTFLAKKNSGKPKFSAINTMKKTYNKQKYTYFVQNWIGYTANTSKCYIQYAEIAKFLYI